MEMFSVAVLKQREVMDGVNEMWIQGLEFSIPPSPPPPPPYSSAVLAVLSPLTQCPCSHPPI